MVFLIQIRNVQGQDKKLEKANEAYNKFSFIAAAKLYQKEIKNGNNTVEIYTKLGDCYYYNGNYAEAIQYYAKVVTPSNNINPEYYFRYAQALNSVKKYTESEAIMKGYYLKSGKKDLSANWNQVKLNDDINKQSGRYIIKEAEINSPSSDFGTAFYDTNKVIYASAKDTGIIVKRKHSWNDKSFLKLYSADVTVDGGLKNPVLLKGEINTKYHQSSPAITKDGKTMYFTRNNYKDGKLGLDKKGTSYLKIYVAQNVNGEWKNIKELGYPVNSDGFSSAHPALSADETELYFASDRNNNFGNSDLYVVSLKKGGYIGNDVSRLSDEINTLGRETYPYVDASGVLYFSSDGHPGLGGLDVFAAVKDANGLYHVVNLGNEINTNEDDFAYCIQDDTKKGYFSSNRNGNDDIFSFTQQRPLIFDINTKPIVFGVLKDLSGTPVENVAIELYNTANEKTGTFYSDSEGKYFLDVAPYKEFKVVYKKPGMAEKTVMVSPLKPAEKREFSFYDFMKEMEIIVDNKKVVLADGDDLRYKLNLNPIYFDYNGFKIRESSKVELDKIIELMKARPSISIEINSHTDSRGRDDFNLKLSQNRAKATVDYIVEHGINAEKVVGQGFGEARLINKCSNGVKCSEAEHQENRRSEFIIHVK